MSKVIIKILVLALLFSSCQENIDFDLNTEKSRLVIDGGISTQKKRHLIKLTETVSFYQNEAAQGVSGANVQISGGGDSWTLIEGDAGEYYTDSVQGKVGVTYQLTINHNGETYEASEYLFPVVDIDTIPVLKEEGFDFENDQPKDFVNIYLKATEAKGLGDYYLWKFKALKPDTAFWKDMTPKYRDWTFASDEFVDGNSPEKGWQIFGGYDTTEIPYGTIIEFEMNSISKEYYTFLDAIGKQVFRGGLFDGPPANVPTNMSNGALGYFWAADVTTSKTYYRND